jgi:hypothetical protein
MARSKQAKPIGRGRPLGQPQQQRPGGPTLADAGSRIPRLNPTVRRKRRMRPGMLQKIVAAVVAILYLPPTRFTNLLAKSIAILSMIRSS